MASANDVHADYSLKERQFALDAVLASNTFSRNPRLGNLLAYLCGKSFAGQSGCLKEYTIATDVFGRPSEFDQSTDAIVRVEMHRLRKKLKEFYSGEGINEELEIVIQSGQYVPEFVSRLGRAPKREEPQPRVSRNPRKMGSDDFQSRTTPATGHALSAPAKSSANSFRAWRGSVPFALKAEPASLLASQNRRWTLVVALAIIVVTATTWLVSVRHSKSHSSAQAVRVYQVERVVSAGPASEPLRIMCGRAQGQLRDREGNFWGPDAFFEGGTAEEVAEQAIYRTRNPFLFRSRRAGDFSYKIPVKPGVYELHLYFADTSYKPGMSMEGGENTRFFNIDLNGKLLVSNLDIIASAGPNTAYERIFKDIQPANDEYIQLKVMRVVGTPILNAIEVLPAALHRIRPIRISTQDGGYTDKSGLRWQPDDYFLAGRNISKFGVVTGLFDPQIYERERYGNFSYAIPAAPGKYRLNLHFAETFFGPGEQGGGGVGERVFDVYCNGVALLRNFDVFREAGVRRQVIKSFSDIEPNAQGTVLLSFVPRKNYAMVSAIELIDESEQ